MSILAIVDEIALLLEADPMRRDDSCARPVTFMPDTLYAWPPVDKFTGIGLDFGAEDKRDFQIRVAWVTDAGHEIAAERRERATTDVIHAKAEDYVARVQGQRAGDNYHWLQVDQVDYESLSTTSFRGFYLDLSGYALPS